MYTLDWRYQEALEDLERLGATLEGEGGALQRVWFVVGEQVLSWVAENFSAQGTLLGGKWERVTGLGMLHRATGGRPVAYRSWSDLQKAASGLAPLSDTGTLRDSLTTRGARNNVFRVADMSITVGSADPRANLHQTGASVPIPFPKHLDDRVSKRLRQGKPRTTPTGRESRAQAYWNPFYFELLAVLNREAGKRKKLPVRIIVPTGLKPDMEAVIVGLVEDTLGAILQEFDGRAA